MGVTISAPVASARLQAQVLAFFNEHWRPWTLLTKKNPPYDYFADDRVAPRIDDAYGPADDLSYDHRKFKVGFDFGTGLMGGEQDYVFAICRWIALRAGRRRRFPKLPGFGPVPFMVYDGYEPWPVLVRGTCRPPANMRWCLVDKLGVRGPNEIDRKHPNKMREHRECFRVIRRELRRLDRLWGAS